MVGGLRASLHSPPPHHLIIPGPLHDHVARPVFFLFVPPPAHKAKKHGSVSMYEALAHRPTGSTKHDINMPWSCQAAAAIVGGAGAGAACAAAAAAAAIVGGGGAADAAVVVAAAAAIVGGGGAAAAAAAAATLPL